MVKEEVQRKALGLRQGLSVHLLYEMYPEVLPLLYYAIYQQQDNDQD